MPLNEFVWKTELENEVRTHRFRPEIGQRDRSNESSNLLTRQGTTLLDLSQILKTWFQVYRRP
jgi:hypothetical protein